MQKKNDVEEDEPAPPLPPKPKQKISMIGLPNADNFLVMDNSAVFSKPGADEITHSHGRSDSGLSSLSSITAITTSSSSQSKSGSSSVRSSSIVSDCSSKIDELFETGCKEKTTFVSQCSLKLGNLTEQEDEVCETSSKRGSLESEKSLSSVTGVQRQLETIKQQKEILIKDIVTNEELGQALRVKCESVMSLKEMEKFNTFLEELEKVTLLVLSIRVRLQKAEEELSCGNLTDMEKESRWSRRDKLVKQLTEAETLKSMSDRRKKNIEQIIQTLLSSDDLDTFGVYINKKEELLIAQRACEDSEKSILSS